MRPIHKIAKRFYPVDFVGVKRGCVTTFMELKTRHNPRLAYADYMISLTKYLAGAEIARVTGLNFQICVHWIDAVGVWDWRRMQPTNLNIKIGGRRDRGDAADIEPVVHLPLSEFLIL